MSANLKINKILVANRGEIAVRVIRAAKELNIQTIAVYSKADVDALHTRLADEKVCIGEPPSQQSYLFYQNLLGAAESLRADAIHPGYGFLAENPDFAAASQALGIKFIGPAPDSMRLMAHKSVAKQKMKEAGVPVIPGSEQSVESLPEAKELADNIGYPIILKAAEGGGGKGMRIVNSIGELKSNFLNATQEAEKAFNSGELYIEKYLPNSRHIEVQILGDEAGNIVHLFERECSVQRNHQKLLEETPCAFLTPTIRDEICSKAVDAAKNIGYHSAGTVEFLYDIDNDEFYFMEMNTRIQVEHPVSEMITGVDILKKQIEIAAGEQLNLKQSDIINSGHAIECRINAENWKQGFRSSPGNIEKFTLPGGPGIRVDTAFEANSKVLPYYDSLLAKLIAYGADREESIQRMQRALAEFIVTGVHTTIGFHKKILKNKRFVKSDISTSFVENEFKF